ncbi:unnamed protein product [Rodentolepis nana]|uniref:TRPM tetramerisation domain-containing protein n=1 Tax=Rodentolepis nana TaxID=102285 RepID=A0A3P7T107_RODNA|nr:unnamed protein product [Rodentolepis nana]
MDAKEVEKLHDFEEECVEDYCREKKIEESKQAEVHLGNISSGIAAMEYRLKEVHLRQQQLRGDIHTIHDEVLAGREEVISKLYENRTGSQRDLLPGGAVDLALLGSVVWLLRNSIDRENVPVTEDNYFDDRSNSGVQRRRHHLGDNDVTSVRAHCRRQACQQNRPKFSSKLSSHTEEDDIDGNEMREIQGTDSEVRDYSTERMFNRGATRQARRLRHEKFRQQRRNAMGLDDGDSDDDLEMPPESAHTANDWLRLLAERILEQRNLAKFRPIDLESLGRQQQQRSSQRHGLIRHRSSLSQSPSLSAQTSSVPYSRPFDGIHISPSTPNSVGIRHSHRGIPTIPHIAANREYTTILDDIDISQLLQPDSPTTSPMGSRTDLQQIPAITVSGPATAKHGKRRRGTRFAIPSFGADQQPGFELGVPETKRNRHRHHKHRERRSPSVPTFAPPRAENESPIASTSLDHLVPDAPAMSHQLCRSSFSNAHPPSLRSSQNFLDDEGMMSARDVSDENIFAVEKEDNQLADEDSNTPKDPLHLAEAAEWNELEGVVIRRLRQLSVAMEEEAPFVAVPPQDESEYCDDGATTIPHIADAQTSAKNNSGTSDDVWNAAATALEEATTHGVEVVDPDLDLDYIPSEVPMVVDSLHPVKPTSPTASTAHGDGHGFNGEESGGTSNRRHHSHRFHPSHHPHI